MSKETNLRLYYLTRKDADLSEIIRDCMLLTQNHESAISQWDEWFKSNHGKIVLRYKGSLEKLQGTLPSRDDYTVSGNTIAIGPCENINLPESVRKLQLRNYSLPTLDYQKNDKEYLHTTLYSYGRPLHTIVMRGDLTMPDGKMIGQIMHVLSFALDAKIALDPDNISVIAVPDSVYYTLKKDAKIVITDAAHTVFDHPTETACLI